MKVRDIYETMTKGADVVREDELIPEVVKKVARNQATRSVFVVNDAEQLVGIIDVRDLLRVAGADYLPQTTRTIIPYLRARKASDIMQPPYAVKPDDDLKEALRVFVQQDLQDIPVVEDGKVVGDLNCFEVLLNVKMDFRETVNGD